MDLSQRVSDLWSKAKEHVFLPENKESNKQYLMDSHLGKYFTNATEEQRQRYTSLLEQNVDKSFEKYRNNIESAAARFGGKAGVSIGLSEILFNAIGVPARYISGSTYALILGKTVLETPKLYNYMKNIKDLNGVYGLAMYSLRKLAGLALPFVGPVIEGKALKDMLLKRVLYESKKGFLKDIGRYESIYDRIKNRVEDIAGKIKLPEYKPAYQVG